MPAPLSRYRERITLLGKPSTLGPIGRFKRYSNGVLVEDSPVNLTGLQSSKLIERSWDQINASTGRSRSGKHYSVGGPFISIKVRNPAMEWQGGGTYSTAGNPNFGSSSLNRWEYTGSFSNPDLTYDNVSVGDYSTAGGNASNLNPLLPSTAVYEPRVWDSAPNLEKSSLANFLYEFKDVPGQLRQTSEFFKDIWKEMGGDLHKPFMHPKRVADDFLNVQFGWMPFVSDIAKLCDAVIYSRQYLHDISNANNTWVSRRLVHDQTESLNRIKRLYSPGCEPSGFNVIGLCRDMVLDGNTCKGYMDVYEEKHTRVWSTGQWKYYRPEFDMGRNDYSSYYQQLQRTSKILGLNVSPVHIWKAIPYSWAVDWFSNIGENIKRAELEALDGVVARNVYLMHMQMRSYRSFHLFNFWSGAKALQWTRFIETKQRKAGASPYGFNLFGKDLSANQWSILVALGLSRNVRMTSSF